MTTRSLSRAYGTQEFWTRPDEWLPERFLSSSESTSKESGHKEQPAFMPFLTGPRSCIGRQFAILELLVLLMIIAKRTTLVRPASSQPEIIQVDSIDWDMHVSKACSLNT